MAERRAAQAKVPSSVQAAAPPAQRVESEPEVETVAQVFYERMNFKQPRRCTACLALRRQEPISTGMQPDSIEWQ